MTDDKTIAAWAQGQNRGVPSWDTLSEEARAWWRQRFEDSRA